MAKTLVQATILLLLPACAQPGPVTVNVAPTAPPSAPAAEQLIVSVSTTRAPSGLVIDGDLREWGALPPPPPSLPRPTSKDDVEERETDAPKEKRPPPNPPDAASRLAFALTAQAAFIAAELDGSARDGIVVGIGSRVPAVPLIGEYFGNLGFVVLNCETKPMVHDYEGTEEQGYSYEPRDPEEQAACRPERARYAEAKAKHDKRFARLFKIDKDGVRAVAEGGALVPIEGAKSAWKPGPAGATVEIMLPLAAMPRLADAPLRTLRLVARATPNPAELASAPWVWVALPEPVSFEPLSALRAHAFERALDVPEDNSIATFRFQQPRGMSYQPGDPLHVEIVEDDPQQTIVVREELLYQKLGTLGDIEVGRVAAPGDDRSSAKPYRWLAIFRRGEFLRLLELPGSPRGTVARDGELHVLSYEPKYGAIPAVWSAAAIAPGGASREVVVEPVPGGKALSYYDPSTHWDNVSDFASNDLETFGWRGNQGGQGMEATWRWDAKRKVYTGKQRNVPVQKKSGN